MTYIDVGNIGRDIRCDVPGLIESKLSDAILGLDVGHIFRSLPEPLYRWTAGTNTTGTGGRSGRWTAWQLSRVITKEVPGRPGVTGASVALYLEVLARIVDEHKMSGQPRRRTWQGDDDHKPVRNPDAQSREHAFDVVRGMKTLLILVESLGVRRKCRNRRQRLAVITITLCARCHWFLEAHIAPDAVIPVLQNNRCPSSCRARGTRRF